MATFYELLVFLVMLLIMAINVASHPMELKALLKSTTIGNEPSLRTSNKLTKPLVGDDGKIYACLGKNLVAFESNGSVAWIIYLSYICNVDIAPVGDGRGQIYLVAEDKILKITPSNIVSSEYKIEIFFSLNSTAETSEKIIGLAISVPYSSLFITIQNRGVFSFSLRGQLMWSAGPILYRFGYPQGCIKVDCYFNSAPVVDRCEGTLYISNTEGQLYSLYIRTPNFRWIQDFSSVDKLLTITPGNNGLLYVTFPRRALLMALKVSNGKIMWQNSVGPLSTDDHMPAVDSNGWVSISSIDGYLYSFSPTGDMNKYLEKTASDSVAQVSPVLDCSGFAVYVSQTIMATKSIHYLENYTYISAMNPVKLVVSLLVPATGTVYWTATYPGDLSSFFSMTALRYFALDERILLTLLASGRIGSTLPCYTTRQKLSWTCSQGEHKFVSTYTGSERAILLFVLLQFVIIVLLAGLVQFCCIFWRKRKLQDHGLGKFLERRRSLLQKKQALNKMISELEQKASAEATTSQVLAQMGEIVKAKESVEKKLTTSYSFGRDSFGPQGHAVLPLYDGSTRSHSFHNAKKESVTIFHTLSDHDVDDDDDTCSSSSRNSGEEEQWQSCSSDASPSDIDDASRVFANPLFDELGLGLGFNEIQDEAMEEGVGWKRRMMKRRTLSSTN